MIRRWLDAPSRADNARRRTLLNILLAGMGCIAATGIVVLVIGALYAPAAAGVILGLIVVCVLFLGMLGLIYSLTLPTAKAGGFWRFDSLSLALPPAQEQGYNIHES